VDETWTLPELVSQAVAKIAALPAPKNGQVRAIPDERTIRYYGTIGLLDRPVAMRGRTALYGRRHLAQVVAIKRLQSLGRSLAEIQASWPTLDDDTLARMSGVELPPRPRAARKDFWRREAEAAPAPAAAAAPVPPASAPVALAIQLAPNVSLSISLTETGVSVDSADLDAIRAAAAPLLATLAERRLTANDPKETP
jgi:DNA-binding transcriptional MerR regulator